MPVGKHPVVIVIVSFINALRKYHFSQERRPTTKHRPNGTRARRVSCSLPISRCAFSTNCWQLSSIRKTLPFGCSASQGMEIISAKIRSNCTSNGILSKEMGNIALRTDYMWQGLDSSIVPVGVQ